MKHHKQNNRKKTLNKVNKQNYKISKPQQHFKQYGDLRNKLIIKRRLNSSAVQDRFSNPLPNVPKKVVSVQNSNLGLYSKSRTIRDELRDTSSNISKQTGTKSGNTASNYIQKTIVPVQNANLNLFTNCGDLTKNKTQNIEKIYGVQNVDSSLFSNEKTKNEATINYSLRKTPQRLKSNHFIFEGGAGPAPRPSLKDPIDSKGLSLLLNKLKMASSASPFLIGMILQKNYKSMKQFLVTSILIKNFVHEFDFFFSSYLE